MGLGRPEWAMALCPPPAVVGVGWGGFSAAVCFCLHCSLLSGKEANEEAALRVVKETESEGEERPSRGETTKQVFSNCAAYLLLKILFHEIVETEYYSA